MELGRDCFFVEIYGIQKSVRDALQLQRWQKIDV